MLYTFFCNYDDGTFIHQIHSLTVCKAIEIWCDEFDLLVMNIPEQFRTEIKDDLSDSAPTVVTGLENVWCTTFSAAEKVGILHIVGSIEK